jgi:hypothetical protein
MSTAPWPLPRLYLARCGPHPGLVWWAHLRPLLKGIIVTPFLHHDDDDNNNYNNNKNSLFSLLNSTTWPDYRFNRNKKQHKETFRQKKTRRELERPMLSKFKHKLLVIIIIIIIIIIM